MKFSIGYNYDIGLLDSLSDYSENVEALYFPIPQQYLGSGRDMLQPEDYKSQIKQIIKKCHALNITPQLLLNATCEGKAGIKKYFIAKIIRYIKELKSLGLEHLIIANPAYIKRLKQEISGAKIESSVNCFIRTVEHALYLKNLGADVLTIDRDINRNIPLIKQIKRATDLKIKVMLNEGCLRNCPFRITHYNYLSHGIMNIKGRSKDIFIDKFCVQIYLQSPEKVFSIPFIPPEGLRYYEGIADFYKLSTRVFSTEKIESCLKAYSSRKFDGNLLDILDSPGLSYYEYIDYRKLKKLHFFTNILGCQGRCEACGYCNLLLEKAVLIKRDSLKEVDEKMQLKAIKIYSEVLKNNSNTDRALIYEKLGWVYLSLRKYREAISFAKKSLRLTPKEKVGYLLLGSVYEKSKKFNDALKVYRKGFMLFPFEPEIYLALSRVYFNLNRYKKAMRKAKEAIRLNYKQKGAYSLLGFCYEKLKNHQKAVEIFKKELIINPSDVKARFALAHNYRALGKIHIADKELNRGILKVREEA